MTSERGTGKGNNHPAPRRNSPRRPGRPAHRGGEQRDGAFPGESFPSSPEAGARPSPSLSTRQRRRCRAHPACSRQPRMALRLLPRLQAPPAWGARSGVPLGCCGVRAATSQPPGQGGGCRQRGPTHLQRLPPPPAPSHRHRTARQEEALSRAASCQQRTGRPPSRTPPPSSALVKHFWGEGKGPDRHSTAGCWWK